MNLLLIQRIHGRTKCLPDFQVTAFKRIIGRSPDPSASQIRRFCRYPLFKKCILNGQYEFFNTRKKLCQAEK